MLRFCKRRIVDPPKDDPAHSIPDGQGEETKKKWLGHMLGAKPPVREEQDARCAGPCKYSDYEAMHKADVT